MLKKLLFLILLIAIGAVGVGFWGYQQATQFTDQPVLLKDAQLIEVKPGTSYRKLVRQFEQKQWISETQWARFTHRLFPELTEIKAGTYWVEPNQSLATVLTQLKTGKEHQFSITFVEGSRFSEWQQQLEQAPYLDHELSNLSEKEIAEKLGVDRSKLEGLFLAETYHYTAGMSDFDILERSHHALVAVLNTEWKTKSANLPLKSSYEALILASIIEKETAIDSERERVSSVFVNRLKRGMRLQTDPTVIYGMGDKYDGNIRKKDLRTPTAYNTYTINGLPPTPIAMAGPASIRAALHPETSRYLYFVADGTGGHKFTKSLVEHNKAVRAYLRTLRN
ncbi:endolytic transglycosylase MltG [Aliivibrio sp. S3MY1]|uniref:endolytic transglycosylase MltG n=1 Tax=unclassified Aliivibrio TaxID=2645654 RepID=UPI00237A0566|nr:MULTISPECIES: endolytic transglycosylase MltG [unclassified Aliivibrio]MDD9195461.1 endolytic transglycosylase MltG [Aliivibrio sp. S3MY1]MDD9198756.1 endolytic transglycosylase MltG [Aliivibrio sp. S2MY1]